MSDVKKCLFQLRRAVPAEQRTWLKPSQIVDYEYVKDLSNFPERLLIDVREPSELDAGKIPTSINIPSKTVGKSLKLSSEIFFNKFGCEKLSLEIETEMIFHCRGERRGKRATEVALLLGFMNCKGSFYDWSQ